MRPLRLQPQDDERKTAGSSSTQRPASVASTDLLHSENGLPLSPFPPSAPIPQKEPSVAADAAEKNTPPVTPTRSSLSGTSQLVPGSTRSAGRVVIIPASKKRKQAISTTESGSRHLSLKWRQTILLGTILLIFGGTLFTLLPLATSQSGAQFFSKLSTLINFQQNNLQVSAHQTETATTSHITTLTLSTSEYVAIARQDAVDAGIPSDYFVRQIQLESGFNPNAVSPSGAIGIAQFMPATAAGLGIDPWDPIQALKGAAQMMANLYHQYGDYAKALAAYNAGSANLNNAIASCGANWLSCMPAQTQNYVATIMG